MSEANLPFPSAPIGRATCPRACGSLTTSEWRVLRIIGDGSNDCETAARLSLDQSTVRTHRRNIMRKLNVTSSAKLVHEAARFGLISSTPTTRQSPLQIRLAPPPHDPPLSPVR